MKVTLSDICKPFHQLHRRNLPGVRVAITRNSFSYHIADLQLIHGVVFDADLRYILKQRGFVLLSTAPLAPLTSHPIQEMP